MRFDQDRAFARALSEAIETPSPDVFRRTERDVRAVQAVSVCEVMGSLAKLSISHEDSTIIGDDGIPGASSLGDKGQCVSCLEVLGAEPLFLPLCAHKYCKDCVRRMFLAATKDTELYPPRCCMHVFPPGIALRLLSYRELAAFVPREWSSVVRIALTAVIPDVLSLFRPGKLTL